METLGGLAFWTVLIGGGVFYTRFKNANRANYLASYAFPAALAQKLREAHPQLSETDAYRVLEALRQWFIACANAKGKMIAMPSRVVDDAWHEFILMTRLYHAFCDEAFGHYLHHTPSAVSTEPVASKIPDTLEVLEKAKVAPPGELPALFTVDEQFRIERGRRWMRTGAAGGPAVVVAVGGTVGGDGGCSSGCSAGDGCSGGDGCGGCGGCCG